MLDSAKTRMSSSHQNHPCDADPTSLPETSEEEPEDVQELLPEIGEDEGFAPGLLSDISCEEEAEGEGFGVLTGGRMAGTEGTGTGAGLPPEPETG